MSNREKYLKAASLIEPSEDFFTKVIKRIEEESKQNNNVEKKEHDEIVAEETIYDIDQK